MILFFLNYVKHYRNERERVNDIRFDKYIEPVSSCISLTPNVF